ncbi:hypothetical protein AWC29_26455 [Mycobacterium triplex]|uniref:MarR family transcriptional regulator n=2 Tax=Mycobacterium simiae complex TaxID=2249310 RepID=A0A024K468_9MYCO|nr:MULTISPECIES: MarR family transcriptional regulator [Mycobacterium simiae complex]MCV7412453.1 MarR family transcriptional regulator [Mycobacterium florentinum]ORV54436.1 hypothetical protein AWC05_17710 [Mycobacterium florentinum]ORW99907.1 hypothetical protein AWC29_26455 [Mycobacterium triplex]CDO90278.1 MarR family transcriptional regulator [Mycobacterium triplex]BBX81836.1 MarR family transcriptional regulator [Mycobacterium florentinum]
MKAKETKRSGEIFSRTAFLITDVARRYRVTFDQKVRDLNLARTEWWLLRHLYFLEGSTQAELTELMDITKGGMGKVIDRLEKEGLVRRCPDDNDRRSNRIFLTPKTKPLASQLHRLSEQVERRALFPLSDEEIATLDHLLNKMRDGFIEWENEGVEEKVQPKKRNGRSTTRARE